MSFNRMPNKCGVAIPGKKPNGRLQLRRETQRSGVNCKPVLGVILLYQRP